MHTKKLYQWLMLMVMFVSTSVVAQLPGDTRTRGIFGPKKETNRPVYNPDGSVRMPDGSVQYPDGTIILPNGTIRYPNGTSNQPQQNRPPVYDNNQHQHGNCNMPPGKAKKMYGDKSAKEYAHGKKQCKQKNKNDRYDEDDQNDEDDRYDNRNVNRYPQTNPQYPAKKTKRF